MKKKITYDVETSRINGRPDILKKYGSHGVAFNDFIKIDNPSVDSRNKFAAGLNRLLNIKK
jgi:hypothetical protein